ncbi:M13 family metallopeptidase [Janthinobacterium sp. B9-8]|uniref:M13 family metallopeptidase n=1 Tax=Janthinobacterium sp. B9-8 TaxID=1236179 RepID=UPI00061D18E3|nr:M13 family metallopeptidase [Janthinobacterium sp. B9-8]AMC34653.1 peptidase M13 [Janthinobacterium sp. B9-8]
MKQQFVLSIIAATLAFGAQATSRSGLDAERFDQSIRVQDDLYHSVNGTWLKNTEIPSDKPSHGAFLILRDRAEAQVRSIVETAASQNGAPGSAVKKVGDLYQSYMNEALVEQRGLAPLQATLAAIADLKNQKELAAQFAQLSLLGLNTPFGVYVGQDEKNSTAYIINVYQTGLSLPDRDYYLKSDAKFMAAREALATYFERLLKLSGESQVDVAALLAFETELAQGQWTKVENRDPQKTYNKKTLAELKTLAPDFAWDEYWQAMGVQGKAESVVVSQPSYIKAMSQIIAKTPLATLKVWLKFKTLDQYANALPKAYVDLAFDFHGKALSGVPEQKPRWKKAIAATNSSLGEAVGELYIAKHFTPEAKAKMDVMVKNLMASYRTGIKDLSWMSAATMLKAQEKLSKFTVKIGYPEQWIDYSTLDIKADDLLGNLQRAKLFERARDFDKLGKPIDRKEWGMTPQTVNAYYNPSMNEIVFPAAILQAPFFDPSADDAVNYGAIGGVIGHEISHGFDDQGSQYDGDGNLKNWWGKQDSKAFKALTSKLVAQYDAYEAIPGKHVNGKLTLGENIADLSGLAVAYKAYQLSLAGKPSAKIDGYSGEQRFFLGWSQVWASKMREPMTLQLLLTDPHSPGQFRANGAAVNSDAFYKAFNVKEGDAMYKPSKERIRIW